MTTQEFMKADLVLVKEPGRRSLYRVVKNRFGHHGILVPAGLFCGLGNERSCAMTVAIDPTGAPATTA